MFNRQQAQLEHGGKVKLRFPTKLVEVPPLLVKHIWHIA